MKRAVALLVAFMVMVGFASMATAGEVKMILATGGTAETYYPFGGAMAKIWNTKVPGVNVTAQATGASAENVRLVNKQEAELALVQSDTIDFAYNAKGDFKEKLTKLGRNAIKSHITTISPKGGFTFENRSSNHDLRCGMQQGGPALLQSN